MSLLHYNTAATTVQRHFRGHQARKDLELKGAKNAAVVPIQRRWRLVMLRRSIARRVREAREVGTGGLCPFELLA